MERVIQRRFKPIHFHTPDTQEVHLGKETTMTADEVFLAVTRLKAGQEFFALLVCVKWYPVFWKSTERLANRGDNPPKQEGRQERMQYLSGHLSP